MHADMNPVPAVTSAAGDVPSKRPATTLLLSTAVLIVAAAGIGRPHAVRAAEEGPPRDRAAEAGDAAGRLDRIVEKLDRLVDRMNAERMVPPGPPPAPHMPPGGPRGEPRGGHQEHGHHGPRDRMQPGEPGGRGPGPGARPDPGHGHGPGPGMGSAGEGRPGRPGPRGDMPAEMRDIMQQRMREAQRRMEEAGDKFRQLEERIRKLEAEVERLKSG